MAGLVKAGYMGIATLGGNSVRCTSFNVSPTQSLLFYNHVIGLKDTIPMSNATKGEDLSRRNIQRTIWRPSTFIASGNVSFPLTENSTSYVFDTSKNATYFNTDFTYYCGGSRRVIECRVNTFDLNVTAGDVATVSLGVLGKEVTEGSNQIPYQIAEKLLTWDKVKVTAEGIDSRLISGFSLKINNNLKPIYINGIGGDLEDLRPCDIRVGMQEVSGSITVYLKAGQVFLNPAPLTTIRVIMHTLSFNITAVFTPSSMEGMVGPIVTNVPFTGVDYYFT